MIPEAQRIAIAEACGWRQRTEKESNYAKDWVLYKADVCVGWRLEPPDYLNDLNAMHEADKMLTDEQKRKYAAELGRAYDGSFLHVTATAAQRAEAFLKVLGLWKEAV